MLKNVVILAAVFLIAPGQAPQEADVMAPPIVFIRSTVEAAGFDASFSRNLGLAWPGKEIAPEACAAVRESLRRALLTWPDQDVALVRWNGGSDLKHMVWSPIGKEEARKLKSGRLVFVPDPVTGNWRLSESRPTRFFGENLCS